MTNDKPKANRLSIYLIKKEFITIKMKVIITVISLQVMIHYT